MVDDMEGEWMMIWRGSGVVDMEGESSTTPPPNHHPLALHIILFATSTHAALGGFLCQNFFVSE